MPRFSRISWKSRDEAEPPRIESRIDAAKRRRSERAMPGAPTQTWYCSVFFLAKTSPGGGAFTIGRLTRGPPAGGRCWLCARCSMRIRHARVDHRVLARGRCVQLAAQPVEDLGDLLRRVRARALEQEVFDEVRDARLRLGLVTRAGADPEPDRDRADARDALRDHALARVELREDVLLHPRIIASGPPGAGPRGRGSRPGRAPPR